MTKTLDMQDVRAEIVEVLIEIDQEFSDTMVIEFAEKEWKVPSNDNVAEYLRKRKNYYGKFTEKEIDFIRKVFKFDMKRNGW